MLFARSRRIVDYLKEETMKFDRKAVHDMALENAALKRKIERYHQEVEGKMDQIFALVTAIRNWNSGHYTKCQCELCDKLRAALKDFGK